MQKVTFYFNTREKALTFFTDIVRITNVANSANADCSVIVDLAFGIHATLGSEARVLTFFLDACKVDWAFWVRGAFRSWC